MLTLTRQIRQTIVIGDDIRVTVVGVRDDGAVRLSVAAPRNVTVYREEIYDRIRRERGVERLGPRDSYAGPQHRRGRGGRHG